MQIRTCATPRSTNLMWTQSSMFLYEINCFYEQKSTNIHVSTVPGANTDRFMRVSSFTNMLRVCVDIRQALPGSYKK